jgi:hypothetical protein
MIDDSIFPRRSARLNGAFTERGRNMNKRVWTVGGIAVLAVLAAALVAGMAASSQSSANHAGFRQAKARTRS